MATPSSTLPWKRKTWLPFFYDDVAEGVQQNLWVAVPSAHLSARLERGTARRFRTNESSQRIEYFRESLKRADER